MALRLVLRSASPVRDASTPPPVGSRIEGQCAFLRKRTCVSLKPRFKPEILGRRICRASANSPRGSPARRWDVSQKKLLDPEGGKVSHADGRGSSRARESSWTRAPKLIAGGAAAAAAIAAASLQLGSQLVKAVDSVPLLAHLETILGTAVTARFAVAYLGDKKARDAVDAKLADMLGNLRGALGLESADAGPEGAEAAGGGEPSMLEVELRSMINDAASVAAAHADEAPRADSAVVAVDRPTLIASVSSLIKSREGKAVDAIKKLQSDLESSEEIRSTLAELQRSKQARLSRRGSGEAATLAKLRALQEENQKLLTERSQALSQVSALHGDVSSLSRSVKQLTEDKVALSRHRDNVDSQLETLERSNGELDREGERRQGEMEAKLAVAKAAHEAAAEAERTLLTQQLRQAKGERDEALTQLRGLQERLTSVEGQLREVIRSRDSLLLVNAELHKRVSAAAREKGLLAAKVEELEESAAGSRLAGLAQEMRASASSSGSNAASRLQAWGQQAGLENQLRAAEEERKKYAGAVKWLQQQLASLREEEAASERGLRYKSSLEFAQRRADEEEVKVADIHAKLAAIEAAASSQQAELRERVTALETTVGELRAPAPFAAKASAAEADSAPAGTAAAAAAAVAAHRPPLGAQAQGPGAGSVLGAGTGTSVLPHHPSPPGSLQGPEPLTPHSLSAGGHTAAKGSRAGSAVGAPECAGLAKGEAGRARPRWTESRERVSPRLTPMNEQQLQTYARAIFPAFVPRGASPAERLKGGDALVKDLVHKGAKEKWAQSLVHGTLLPTLSGSQSPDGAARTLQDTMTELEAMEGDPAWAREFVAESFLGAKPHRDASPAGRP